jgi:hypothetical protein
MATPLPMTKGNAMFNVEATHNLLQELTNERLDITKDAASISNKFTTRPQGFIIQDSYNNPFLPIRPRPRVDTSKMDLIHLFKRTRELYGKFSMSLLPWHYVVEFIGDRYYVFNTRPVDLRFPLTTNEVLKFEKRKESWDEVTNLFMSDKIFDISEAIHICIIGDSNLDIYTKKIYELIGRSCIVPFVRYFKIPRGLFQRIFPLNIGSKFNIDYISKFTTR